MDILDSTDFEIIKILDKNCRTPYSTIAKEVNLSIRAVSLRISSLVENRIITRFTVNFNTNILGLRHYICSCSLSPNVKNLDVIRALKEIQEIERGWEYIDGTLGFSLFCKSAYHLEQTINKIIRLGFALRDYSESRTINPPDIPFSTTDWKIIYNLLNNSRVSNSEIAEKLNLNEKTIKRRLIRLKTMKLLQFVMEIDFEAIKGMVTAIISIETLGVPKEVYLKIREDKQIKYWRHAELVTPSIALFVYGQSVTEIYNMYIKLKQMKEIKQASLIFIARNWENSIIIEDAILAKIQD